MLGGLYGDLPPPSSAEEDKSTTKSSTMWSGSTLMAPPTLRKPSTALATPKIIVKSQNKTKLQNSASKTITFPAGTTFPSVLSEEPGPPALVGLTSVVIEEYDPARPNDYEEYRREEEESIGGRENEGT